MKFINSAKKRGWNIERISSKDNIADAFVAQSLFEANKLFILEDPNNLSKSKLKWLKENIDELDGTLVIYSKKSLGKRLIKALPKLHKEEEFKLPKIIWSFLESLYPGNATNSLKLFKKFTENKPAEFIFTLIAQRVRDMYFLKVAPESIDYPSWRKNKLKSQLRKFDDGQLEKLITKLSEADLKSKTSKENISDLLDFIIISELE
jgi:hypothetical protein